jgi:heme A synthase
VLFEWVADDESVGRLISIVVHLANTFLLLGALTLTAWYSSGRAVPGRPFEPERFRRVRWLGVALLFVGAAGAVTALGDTLFPKESVGAGFFDDLGGTLIVRLRWIHPVVAVVTAGFLWRFGRSTAETNSIGPLLQGLVAVQVIAGIVNVVLLAPLWMQVLHLLLADAVWIVFVLAASESLVVRERVST